MDEDKLLLTDDDDEEGIFAVGWTCRGVKTDLTLFLGVNELALFLGLLVALPWPCLFPELTIP